MKCKDCQCSQCSRRFYDLTCEPCEDCEYHLDDTQMNLCADFVIGEEQCEYKTVREVIDEMVYYEYLGGKQ